MGGADGVPPTPLPFRQSQRVFGAVPSVHLRIGVVLAPAGKQVIHVMSTSEAMRVESDLLPRCTLRSTASTASSRILKGRRYALPSQWGHGVRCEIGRVWRAF